MFVKDFWIHRSDAAQTTAWLASPRLGQHQRPAPEGRRLFAGSQRAGKRAAAIMSLLHSARINGHDPYVYLRDVLERLPLQPASGIDELLPHRWSPSS